MATSSSIWTISRRAVRAVLFGSTLALVAVAFLGARGVSAATGGVTADVIPGIVDVNTNLEYQGSAAAGTGMMIGSSGVVLTNNHVIAGATAIRVTDKGNGRTYTATVVGYDYLDDVAVLQLANASGLQTVTTGDSSKVRTGDAVTAIGNAGGAGGAPAVTTGKVVGVNRSITATDGGDAEQLTGLIETDAELEPGDSGGPLVNGNDQVIGIDTAGAVKPGYGFQYQTGDGYAIPIDKAMTIANQIEAGTSSARIHVGGTAFLGITLNFTTNQTYGYSSAPVAQGAEVYMLLPNSPLGRAGVVPGDVLTTLGGKRLTSMDAIKSILLAKSPGSTIRITWVDQAGASHAATIRLGSGPPQ